LTLPRHATLEFASRACPLIHRTPSLRNQHYAYLLREMRALADGHRRNVDPDLDLFLANIKEDEMRATADYLSRFSGPTKDRLQMRPNGVATD
jgi:cytochrome c553